MSKDELNNSFAFQLKAAGIPFDREIKAIPGRKLSWDFCIPKARQLRYLLVEVQGAIWVKGGHSTGKGITRDCAKEALAAIAGYDHFNVTKDHVTSGQALKWVQEWREK
jgi:hypothetical protein